jgi:hypothetical protein
MRALRAGLNFAERDGTDPATAGLLFSGEVKSSRQSAVVILSSITRKIFRPLALHHKATRLKQSHGEASVSAGTDDILSPQDICLLLRPEAYLRLTPTIEIN